MEPCEDFEVGPFPRIERPRTLLKRGDLWEGLELMPSGAGIMRDWEWACGAGVELVRPFLRSTGKRASVISCPAALPCECQHAVRETEIYGLVAACCCEEWACETYRLEPEDVLIQRLDRELFGRAVARELGFGAVDGAAYQGLSLFEVGRCGAAAALVYLGMGGSDALLRDIVKVAGIREGAFVLLTPTGSACDASLEQVLRQHGAAHISLSSVLQGLPGGVFVARETAGPMLSGLVERLAGPGRNGALLSNIHREIAAVRSEFVELRTAKQRLEKMLAEGLFAFTKRVDADSFKVLCTILAEGDVAKASRTLAVPDASIRTLMSRWRGMGKEYRAMLDLVRWRKAVGRKETVVLSDGVLLGKANTEDYPGLVADVLEKVTEMTGENWREKAEELEEMLRPTTRGGG